MDCRRPPNRGMAVSELGQRGMPHEHHDPRWRDCVRRTSREIAENTSAACISTRIRQLSRIITRVYDDALRPLGITASQFTLLTQLAQQDGITAVEIGHALDIEKSTLSRNLKRLLELGHITMDPPAGRRGRGLHLTPKGETVDPAGLSRSGARRRPAPSR